MSPQPPEPVFDSSITNAFQEFSIAKDVSDVNENQIPPMPAAPQSVIPQEPRTRQSFAMYPLIFPSSFAPAIPYVTDSFFSSGYTTPVNPMNQISPSYSMTNSLYQTPPSPALTAQQGYSPSRPLSVYMGTDPRRQNATRINRSSYHNVTSHHNHVDISRIRDGIDVRTTVCIFPVENL